MPKFSIIAVDYEHHVNREGMRQGLKTLANQSFKDYELIVIHDGPKNIPYDEEFDFNVFPSVKFLNNPERIGDWGHTGRDLGMKNATGDYFFHFNIDNNLYPFCLQRISEEIDKTNSLVVIFSIIHYKAAGGNNKFTGLPPIHCMIDAMQLVAHKSVWENVGYWYTKEVTSDGMIYEKICKENSWVHIDEILAENY